MLRCSLLHPLYRNGGVGWGGKVRSFPPLPSARYSVSLESAALRPREPPPLGNTETLLQHWLGQERTAQLFLHSSGQARAAAEPKMLLTLLQPTQRRRTGPAKTAAGILRGNFNMERSRLGGDRFCPLLCLRLIHQLISNVSQPLLEQPARPQAFPGNGALSLPMEGRDSFRPRADANGSEWSPQAQPGSPGLCSANQLQPNNK